MTGFLCIDKPRGPTSFDVVAQVRRILGSKKVGHAGTLDPEASGLLILALGAYTRLLHFLPTEPKIYECGIRFGITTDSLDSAGLVTESGCPIPDCNDLEKVLLQFCGQIPQVPPEYSAIKLQGRRAYDLARAGKKPQLAERTITIHTIDLLEYSAVTGEAKLRVTCGSGTYIRALARDIAQKLGTCGYASFVHRISAGHFRLEQAVAFEKINDAENYIIPAQEAFRGYPLAVIDRATQVQIIHGKDIAGSVFPEIAPAKTDDMLFAYDTENHLIALLQYTSDQLYHPLRVLNVSMPGAL